jgi:hypothetical protein
MHGIVPINTDVIELINMVGAIAWSTGATITVRINVVASLTKIDLFVYDIIQNEVIVL